MEVFLFWFFFSVIVGIYAGNKGRSGIGFFLLSLIISPLLGILFAMVAKAKNTNEPTLETHIKCPDCKEFVLKEARKCKHCRCTLIPQQ